MSIPSSALPSASHMPHPSLSTYHLNNKISYQLYNIKRSKQPDHLLSMLQKIKKQKQNIQYSHLQIYNDFQGKVNEVIRKNLIQKRVNNILNMSTKKFNVSEPLKFVKKIWISPIDKEIKDKIFTQEKLVLEVRRQQEKKHILIIEENKKKLNKIMKILNLNKKMKYFGTFLSSEFDQNIQNRHSTLSSNSMHENLNYLRMPNSFSVLNIPKTKQTKLNYLSNKFKQIQKKTNPKLFILNGQKQKAFYNPLAQDQNYTSIIRKDDKQLTKILIKTLQNQGNFSLTSFSLFYDIFVWQNATKNQIIKFVCKILMGENEEIRISAISETIDLICEKINLSQLLNQNNSTNRSAGIAQNFSQIMKKLIFGQEYVFALKNQYYLTRNTLIESLQRNEQCISIFVNVFYM